MISASKGNNEMVRLLLDLGADPKLKDREGKTASDYAVSGGWTNLAALLRQ